jgi:hypothetical protein
MFFEKKSQKNLRERNQEGGLGCIVSGIICGVLGASIISGCFWKINNYFSKREISIENNSVYYPKKEYSQER